MELVTADEKHRIIDYKRFPMPFPLSGREVPRIDVKEEMAKRTTRPDYVREVDLFAKKGE